MSDATLYLPFKHTIGCRVDFGDDASGEWYDLDIYSESEDPRTALETYLDDEYGDDCETKESKGVFSVVDPTFEGSSVIRNYRLK